MSDVTKFGFPSDVICPFEAALAERLPDRGRLSREVSVHFGLCECRFGERKLSAGFGNFRRM